MISARLNREDEMLIKKYAEVKNISVSELIRDAVMERIEDEMDMQLLEEGLKAFREDSTTYTLEEVEKELGLR